MAANYVADKLREQVQNKLPIDVLKFNIAEGGGGDVTMGSRVTKDLYIAYGQSLGPDAERRLDAEYELTPRFSLKGATTNVGRYVLDLLFRFGFY
jgi:autotransporter translocation and assembly factor TamB